jgi:sulfatase modifying factor 1
MRCPACHFENSGTAKFCMECGQQLAASGPPDLSLGGPTMVPSAPRAAPDTTGTLVADRYELLELLGAGGMGSVHLARDTKPGMGDRRVAIKRILDADDQGVERFLRESSTIAALNHQNIRAVFDRGEDDEGHYLVMEYVEGETLHDRVARDGALQDEAFLALAQGLAKALAFAHRKGVVHRDVKPANVLFAEDGTPKLTDFGLARMGHDSDLSMTGYGMGTLDYASPEQRRDAKSADHRSDIYGLGATLYFAATGESPKTIRESRVPQRWRQTVLKCLEEKAEHRYFSIDELLQDLSGSRRGSSPVAPVPQAVAGAFACPSCESPNPPDKRFCLTCGSGLFQTCPQCQGEERIGVRFCGSCGTDIPAWLEAATEAVRSERERARALEETDRYEEAEESWREVLRLVPGDEEALKAEAVLHEAREAREAREAAAARLNPFGWEVVDATPGAQTGAAKKIRDPATGITFILVEPGEFWMGSPEKEEQRDGDETRHRVTLTRAFYLGETAVTQEQWMRVMGGSNPSHFQGDYRLPVESVSWRDCQEFCRKAGEGYRLPTEAEWEYACRAGTETAFSFGERISRDQVNYDEGTKWSLAFILWGKDQNGTQPVGSNLENAWGFHDMHGNVWEWCQDWYGDYPHGSVTDPAGPSSGSQRVLRGGSWFSYPWSCRSAFRNSFDPDDQDGDVGFRAARTL